MKASALNNRRMRALRRDPIYEAVMTDLCLIGAIDKSVIEKLTGHAVSDHLTNPLGEEQQVVEDADGTSTT